MPVLATRVKMRLSIARYRHDRPAPPFWIGGEYERLGDRHFVSDALGRMELRAWPGMKVEPGDLAWFRVSALEGECFTVETSERLPGRAGKPRLAKPRAEAFTRFVEEVRSFFLDAGLVQLRTPTLVECPGLEPTLEPFAVDEKFLPTSPEIHLKKALAQGWSDIFEIRPCFRKDERSAHHASEFMMLEWYRGFAGLEAVIADLQALLHKIGAPAARETDFAEVFNDTLGFKLTPHTTREGLWRLCADLNLDRDESDTFTDLFHRLMIEKIEPAMALQGPLIVRRFPPEMAALAKFDEQGWGDRFELYWNGLEIANAFYEVTDADEQRRRWEGESRERVRIGTRPLPLDEEMLAALERGIPPTGGIALGLERLFMALHGVRDIRELSYF